MGTIGDDHLGSSFFQCLGRLRQRTGGIDHVIHDHTVSAFHIANDVHDLGFVRPWTALVDDRQVAMQMFCQCSGTDDPSDIGGDDQKILVVFLLEILQKDGRSINIVDRDIEKALNLIGMDIHDQDAVDADALEDIGDNACGNGDTGGTWTTILTGVTEIRDTGGNAFSGSALQCIDHQDDFHQVVIGGSASGLNDENILAADIFIDFDSGFTIGEFGNESLAERDTEFAGYLGGQCRIGIASENH